jgi:hypothetical protein
MNRALIYELATGRLIGEREDVLALGPTGTGKSHLAQALGRAAIQQGYRVLYREAHTLLEELADATLAGTCKDYLTQLAAVPLLIIDDVGMRKLPRRSWPVLSGRLGLVRSLPNEGSGVTTMSESLETTKRRAWERDGFRCQECGLTVVKARGLKPHTHHTIPKSAGGVDELGNLITLCQPCHSTRLGHTFMLDKTKVEDYPQYIKWFLWDAATELLACADSFDPRRPPNSKLLIDRLAVWQQVLEWVKEMAGDYRGIGSGDGYLPKNFEQETEQLNDIIEGLKIAWKAHHTQRALDAIVERGERA